MSADDISTCLKKCNNYKNINYQSHIIIDKREIYWSKLNDWGNTKFSSCIGLNLIQISHGIQTSAKHSYNKGSYQSMFQSSWFLQPSLPPTFSLKSRHYFSSTQINPFFLLPIHNYHNSTFKRSKQTSNYNPHRLATNKLLISFYVWSIAFSFEQNALENNNRPNY